MASGFADPQQRGALSLPRINWFALVATLLLEGTIVAVLISIGVTSITTREQEEPTVLELIPVSEPAPAPPAPTEAEAKPIRPPETRTEIIVPQPKVEIQPARQPVVAAIAPPAPPAPAAPPAASAAPAAPAVGTGPVNVANLGTNLLSGTPPAYPMASRRKRETGTVVLQLVISEEGRVVDVSLHRSSGFPALDQAAIAAVRKWRWSATIRDGRRVSITGLVQIPFVLKNS